jgi:hypothetical protein
MDFTNGEFSENMERVENLINGAEFIDATEPESYLSDEVLRAAVVFLHSTLEEVIRNLYLSRIPHVRIENLNKIPLATERGTGSRPEKILLGQLIPFQGKLVENVIIDSIKYYVDSMNLNNSSQLIGALDLAEVPCASLSMFLPKLNEMMQRRHQIVNQMDRSAELDPLDFPINNISIPMVRDWKNNVELFTVALMDLVSRNPRPLNPRN